MGRVDDARRRAAGERPERVDSAPATAVIELPESEAEHQEFSTEDGLSETFSSEEAAQLEDLEHLAPSAHVNGTSSKALVSPRYPSPATFERISAAFAEKTVVDAQMDPATREQYRRLAAALHHAQAGAGMKVVMIASAVAGEGKTLTASNLSLTLSESYQRNVLLIDADLRRPSLHKVFNIQGSPGLSEGLMALDEQKLPLFQLSRYLTVLPAGKPTSDPTAGLTSYRMRNLIDEGRKAFDWVIIDTPPVGLLTDANLLASMVDGAILVVKAHATPYDLVRRSVEAIGSDRVLGVVLNRAKTQAHGYGYGYGYYSYNKPPSK